MRASYQSLVSGAPRPENLADAEPLAPFADESLAFVEAFSAGLMRLPAARVYPELMSLAFWMRRSAVERLHAEFRDRQAGRLLMPRGTVFHISPSNVDTIFVYSWFLSLLTGNRNIVRLSGKPSAQAEELVGLFAALLPEPRHEAIARRTLLVRYDANDTITTKLSAVCDVRVIWGGDDTVQQIRKLPLPPTSIDIMFSDKCSLALIHAGRWLDFSESEKNRLTTAFYNDAYWFDQMACSSPRFVLWLGEHDRCAAARDDFWPRLESVILQKQARFHDIDYVNKLALAHTLAIESDAAISRSCSNDLVRIWLREPLLHEQRHCGAELFLESVLPGLDALLPLLSRKVQTVAYAGLQRDEIRDFVSSRLLAGIDRFVPFGHALDFSPVWDGFDLLRTFTREVSVV